MYYIITLKDGKETIVRDFDKDEKMFEDIFCDKYKMSEVNKFEEIDNYDKDDICRVYQILDDNNLSGDIQPRESIKAFIIDNVENDVSVGPLLQSIEDSDADYFLFDFSGWSNTPAEPLETAEEMIESVL